MITQARRLTLLVLVVIFLPSAAVAVIPRRASAAEVQPGLRALRLVSAAAQLPNPSAKAAAARLLERWGQPNLDPGEAVEGLEKALALYRQAGDARGELKATFGLMFYLEKAGQMNKALPVLGSLRRIEPQLEDPLDRALALMVQGQVVAIQLRADEAIDRLERAATELIEAADQGQSSDLSLLVFLSRLSGQGQALSLPVEQLQSMAWMVSPVLMRVMSHVILDLQASLLARVGRTAEAREARARQAEQAEILGGLGIDPALIQQGVPGLPTDGGLQLPVPQLEGRPPWAGPDRP